MPGAQWGEDESNDCVESGQEEKPCWNSRVRLGHNQPGKQPQESRAFVLWRHWKILRAIVHPTGCHVYSLLSDLIWSH